MGVVAVPPLGVGSCAPQVWEVLIGQLGLSHSSGAPQPNDLGDPGSSRLNVLADRLSILDCGVGCTSSDDGTDPGPSTKTVEYSRKVVSLSRSWNVTLFEEDTTFFRTIDLRVQTVPLGNLPVSPRGHPLGCPKSTRAWPGDEPLDVRGFSWIQPFLPSTNVLDFPARSDVDPLFIFPIIDRKNPRSMFSCGDGVIVHFWYFVQRKRGGTKKNGALFKKCNGKT